MDEDFDQPRDVETDLIEITSRLGEPDSTHRTSAGSVIWRVVLGILIIVVAAILHFLMWSGVVPWPGGVKAHGIKLWIILLAAMFIGPGVGAYLIFFAIRSLKMWVLTYPTGLFVWHRGKVVAFPWDEIRAIQISGLPDKAKVHQPEEFDGPGVWWFDLSGAGRRILGTTIMLTRADGEQLGVPSTLADFATMGRRIQEETYRRLFPDAWADVQAFRPVSFGPVVCMANGITVGSNTLPWNEFDSLERAQDKLEVRRKAKKKKVWKKVELNELVNPHVLMGIADAARNAPPLP
jgi:hypothetical protein